MPIYRFPITGIRHHAFKGRLDELYECAPGKRVTMSIEPENEAEPDAVICLLGCEHLGYVRSGNDHDAALKLLETSGKRSIIGKVVEVDRRNRVVWVEADAPAPTDDTRPRHKGNLLETWKYDGPLLPDPTELTLLHSVADTLEMLVEQREPWDEDLQAYLTAIGEHCWRDISIEFRAQTERTLHKMTEAAEMKGYAEAAIRLQFIIDHMGSPETRQRQARWLLDATRSEDMQRVRAAYGPHAEAAAAGLPPVFVDLFLSDGEILMGRLWYMRQRHEVIRGVLTLLALNVLLREEAREISYDGISREWMIEWAKRRGDAEADSVVHQLIADFELAQTDAPLLRRLDEMHAACRKGDVVIEQATIDKHEGPISIGEQTFVEGMSPGEVQRLIDERDTKLLTKE